MAAAADAAPWWELWPEYKEKSNLIASRQAFRIDMKMECDSGEPSGLEKRGDITGWGST